MKIKPVIFGLAVCTSFTFSCKGEEKSDNIKPQWTHVMPTRSNDSFVYSRMRSEGSSLADARREAIGNLLEEAGLSKGLSVTSDYTSSRTSHSIKKNDQSFYESSRDFQVNTIVKGKEVNLQARTVDEYWERDNNGKYSLTTLFARSYLDKPANFDDVKLTTKYGLQGLWRSAIIPGWGQLYKGSTLKGGLIMGGTVACIAGIIATDCVRESYNSKIFKTHDVKLKKLYADKRSDYAMGRNICIGALCAVYVYNLVDAVVAPGARRIVAASSKDFSYYWSPTLTEEYGVGVAASFTF